ncbi:hypothetical protein ACWCRD_05550 [Streptomyces sp. NPDC002092]
MIRRSAKAAPTASYRAAQELNSVEKGLVAAKPAVAFSTSEFLADD